MSIKSLNCLTLETIELLQKHRLYEPLLESEIQYEKINSVAINDEVKKEVMNKFINQLGLKTNEEFEEWIHKNKASKKVKFKYVINYRYKYEINLLQLKTFRIN